MKLVTEDKPQKRKIDAMAFMDFPEVAKAAYKELKGRMPPGYGYTTADLRAAVRLLRHSLIDAKILLEEVEQAIEWGGHDH